MLRTGLSLCMLLSFNCLLFSQSVEKAKPGDVININGKKVIVEAVDITPVVENEFSKRGIYERADNPKLVKFRKQENFDKLLAGAKDEFEQMVRIVDWAQKRLPKFGTPTSRVSAPLDIVKAADEGNTFFCNHFACIFVGATASMGWPSRTLALHYGNNPVQRGAPEHSAAEVWSDQYRKWILFDPLFGLYIERDGIPLNAWEVRQEWYYGDRDKITFVLGKDRRKTKHTDKSILMGMHPGFGPLEFNQRAYADKLALIGYCPGNNVIENGSLAYGDMFISTDTIASKIKWHIRINPKDPAVDSYFPLNQAELQFTPITGGLKVTVKTNTPNFVGYRYRINKGKWQDGDPGTWKLKRGKNTLEVKPVNSFGIEGVNSKVVLVQT